jgi:phosphomannomutase
MSVYKACDIRGAVDQLSPELYRAWGRWLAQQVPPGAGFLAGGDVRQTTEVFLAALIDGLVDGGAAAVDLGMVPTPVAWFAGRHLGAAGVAVVTASHSPPDINGLKWSVAGRPPAEAQIQALAAAVAADDRLTAGGAAAWAPAGPERCPRVAPLAAYEQALCRRWRTEAVTGKVVVDPGSGCWAGPAARILRAVFPALTVTAIHDVPDGRFRARNPDSARPEHLTALCSAIRAQDADAGIAFDGDGDRVSLVDGDGVVLSPEETSWVLVQSLALDWPGRTFVHDIKCSDRIAAEVRRLGGQPEAQRSGHAFIRARMIEKEALFGAEVSGHYFYGELAGGDDGLFTACRVLASLAGADLSLAAARRRVPPIYATPDLRLPVPVDEQEAWLARVRDAFADRPQSALDGVRVDFGDGWALVRRSVTAAELTFRFEGDSAVVLDRIVAQFSRGLGGLGARLVPLYARQKAGAP